MKLLLIAVAGSIIFFTLVIVQVWQIPPINQGPSISARPDSPPERFAIVERADFQLVKVSAAKPQNDDDAFAGLRPAWELLVLALWVFLYIYSRDLPQTITVPV